MQDIPTGGRGTSAADLVALIAAQPYGEWVGSDQTAGELLGRSRHTIIRWKNELERKGRIRRCGWKHWGGKKTVRWRVCRRRATQRPSGRRTNYKTTTPFGCGTPRRPASGRRRKLMENHPAPTGGVLVVRASGETTPFNAGDAIAAVVDIYGMPIPSQIKARIGKAAKELLEDGFQPEVVVVACVTAVRMARPHLTASFALEIQNARAGQVIGWNEYRAWIAKQDFDNKPELAAIRDGLKGAFA